MGVVFLVFTRKLCFLCSTVGMPRWSFRLFDIQIGHDKEGLPIGLQLIGRPWGEASILRVASALEVLSLLSSLLYNVQDL